MFEMTEMYRELGISEKVYQFGKEIEKSLEDRFDQIDKVTEFNQLKVIRAMQESRVNEACFNYASGYGYNDQGRDTLEEVYAKTFHTESALVQSLYFQIILLWFYYPLRKNTLFQTI